MRYMEKNNVAIIGAGMAGCFMALNLARRGYKVDIYEYRPDVRAKPYDSGRSFNLTLYYRGILAMKKAGIWEEVKKIAVIAQGNAAHYSDKKVVYDPFDGQADEILFTVHRNQLNGALIDLAEKEPNIKLHFNTRCLAIDPETKTLTFQKVDENSSSSEAKAKSRSSDSFKVTANLVIGADGLHSIVRSEIQKIEKAVIPDSIRDPQNKNLSERIETEDWGYKEVHVSPEKAEELKLRLQATHTWPRPDSLLIAFPNPDDSFTLMFNLPLEGEGSFAKLTTKEAITDYITNQFPDLLPLLPEIIHSFLNKPTGTFNTLFTKPWYYKDFMVLIGDAAHAVIPFYGQGVCAAFEDCLKLTELIDHSTNKPSPLRRGQGEVNLEPIFSTYQESRKKNTDILAQLSKDNFIELRDKSRSMFYIFKDKADTLLHKLFPKFWLPPLYVLIAHGTLEYQEAIKQHQRQQQRAKLIGLTTGLFLMATPWLLIQRLKSKR